MIHLRLVQNSFYPKLVELGEHCSKVCHWYYQTIWEIPFLVDFLVVFYE